MPIIQLLVSACALGFSAYLVPGVVIGSWVVALVVALVLGLLNLFVKPVLVILTLPINIITLGLFSLIINQFLITLTALIVPGFTISGFFSGFIFSIVLSLVNIVFGFQSK